MEGLSELFGPVFEFVKRHAAEIFALFAAGGTGTLVIKHFLGRGVRTQSGGANTATAADKGIAVVQTGGGSVSIKDDGSPPIPRETLRQRFDLPRSLTNELVEKMKEENCDAGALERHFTDFADAYHKRDSQPECSCEAREKADPCWQGVHEALANGDTKLAIRLFGLIIEADQRSASSNNLGKR